MGSTPNLLYTNKFYTVIAPAMSAFGAIPLCGTFAGVGRSNQKERQRNLLAQVSICSMKLSTQQEIASSG